MQSLSHGRSATTIFCTCLRFAFFALFAIIPIAMIFGGDTHAGRHTFEQMRRN